MNAPSDPDPQPAPQAQSAPCPVCGGQDYAWGFAMSDNYEPKRITPTRLYFGTPTTVTRTRHRSHDTPHTESRHTIHRTPIHARECRTCGNVQLFTLRS